MHSHDEGASAVRNGLDVAALGAGRGHDLHHRPPRDRATPASSLRQGCEACTRAAMQASGRTIGRTPSPSAAIRYRPPRDRSCSRRRRDCAGLLDAAVAEHEWRIPRSPVGDSTPSPDHPGRLPPGPSGCGTGRDLERRTFIASAKQPKPWVDREDVEAVLRDAPSQGRRGQWLEASARPAANRSSSDAARTVAGTRRVRLLPTQ